MVKNNSPSYYIVEGGKAPKKSTDGSAGWDIFARKQITIAANSVKPVPVGIKVSCNEDEYFRVADRSGHAIKNNMHIVAGVVDSDYRGEVQVAIHNTGKRAIIISKDMKIAQMVLTKINPSDFVQVYSEENLGETERGEKGGINE